MQSRGDYDKAIAVVSLVIKDWDPYGLLADGAPDDEFDSEIASVVAQIPRIAGPTDAVHVVSRVFSGSFDPETFAPEYCSGVGERLHAALVEAELI